ncbi:MAG TPA: hypothetical protein VE959_31745 [Bryobacteraceae bacterium]|nr:hypothetical protein [Bryobacteraceae bacterium]
MHNGFKIHLAHAPAKCPNNDSRKVLILLDVNCDAQLDQMTLNSFLQTIAYRGKADGTPRFAASTVFRETSDWAWSCSILDAHQGQLTEASSFHNWALIICFEGKGADSEGWRSAFRTDVDHDSEVMPISVPN